MKVRISNPGEYDRFDRVVRFSATIDGRPTNFMLDDSAALVISEALGLNDSTPLQVYQLSGNLLTRVVEQTVNAVGPKLLETYLIDRDNVLAVTGRSGEGGARVPKPWSRHN